ncbi:MAG: sigma-70 family RNA polymerase sigma factor [Gammaproteobacteria bacterium]
MPDSMHGKAAPDQSVAASLFQDYADALHAFLRKRLGGHREHAEDLCQIVFERLCKKDRDDVVLKPQAYLFGIAFNVLREFWIRERRQGEVVTFDSRVMQEADRNLEHAPQTDDTDRANLIRQLDEALAELPEQDRKVLLACKRDGMTYEEASRATGLSVHAVKKNLIKARARLMARTWDR